MVQRLKCYLVGIFGSIVMPNLQQMSTGAVQKMKGNLFVAVSNTIDLPLPKDMYALLLVALIILFQNSSIVQNERQVPNTSRFPTLSI